MGKKATHYLLYNLAVVATAAACAVAILCRSTSSVDPAQGAWWIILGLLVPIVLGTNLCLLIWWLGCRRWLVALLPLAALLFNFDNITAMIQPLRAENPTSHDLKIATFNIHHFSQQGLPAMTAPSIAHLLCQEGVGVACLQEFTPSYTYPQDSITADFATCMPYYVCSLQMAIFSRYPILCHQHIHFPETGNSGLMADIDLSGRAVRVISVHLQTTGISALRAHYRKLYGCEISIKELFKTLVDNTHIRAKQARTIRQIVDTSQMPVVVVGDFNDLPFSYTYRIMRGKLTDGFKASGRGYGATYLGFKKLLRIDYIFYNDYFTSQRYYAPTTPLSDHRPVISELQFKR